MATDLGRWVQGEPISARRIGFAERAFRWCQKNRLSASLAIGVALALVVAGVVGFVHAQLRTEQQRTVAALDKAETNKRLAEEGQQASKVSQQAAEAQKALAEKYRREAERVNLLTAFEHGTGQCEKGLIGQGLVRFGQALALMTDDTREFDHALRMNAAVWAEEGLNVTGVLPAPGLDNVVFDREGRFALVSHQRPEGYGVTLWNLAEEKPVGPPIPHPDRTRGLAIDPAGKWFATADMKATIRFFDAATLAETGRSMSIPNSKVEHLAVSADGSLLAAAAGEKVVVYRVEGRKPIATLPHQLKVSKLAFAPVGTRLLVSHVHKASSLAQVENHKGGIALWDVLKPKPLFHVSTPRDILAIAFAPDGSRFYAGGTEGIVRSWTVADCLAASDSAQAEARIVAKHPRSIMVLDVSPDGDLLATGSDDRTLRLWRTKTGEPFGGMTPHSGAGVFGLRIAADGQTLWAGDVGRSQLTRHRCPTPDSKRVSWGNFAIPLAISHDEKLACVTKPDAANAQIVDVATGATVGPLLYHSARNLKSACFGPNDQTLFVGPPSGGVRLWRIPSGEPIGAPFKPDQTRVYDVAMHPDGTMAASTTQYSLTSVWSIPDGKLLRSDKTPGRVWAVAFSPDGRYVASGGEAGRVMVLDTRTLLPLGQPIKMGSAVRSLAFAPDGTRLAIGGQDKMVHQSPWPPGDGKPAGPSLPHEGYPTYIAYDPRGNFLLVGSHEGSARYWDSRTGRQIGPTIQGTSHCRLAPSGRFAAFAIEGGSCVVRPIPEPIAADADRFVLWAELAGGLTLKADGQPILLTTEEWLDRKARFDGEGGRLSAGKSGGTPSPR